MAKFISTIPLAKSQFLLVDEADAWKMRLSWEQPRAPAVRLPEYLLPGGPGSRAQNAAARPQTVPTVTRRPARRHHAHDKRPTSVGCGSLGAMKDHEHQWNSAIGWSPLYGDGWQCTVFDRQLSPRANRFSASGFSATTPGAMSWRAASPAQIPPPRVLRSEIANRSEGDHWITTNLERMGGNSRRADKVSRRHSAFHLCCPRCPHLPNDSARRPVASSGLPV